MQCERPRASIYCVFAIILVHVYYAVVKINRINGYGCICCMWHRACTTSGKCKDIDNSNNATKYVIGEGGDEAKTEYTKQITALSSSLAAAKHLSVLQKKNESTTVVRVQEPSTQI